ncbi:CoA-transferase [Geomicrobium sp. JSM 1781026]|uniref:CoA-transferase n=1 Tax=Geomicrobium sp. JSM 1781026 TaxID=3344580 RepID=UPI0035BEC6CB
MTKVISLSESVQQFIFPECVLHFSFTHNRAMAYAWEIIRQNKNQALQLELVGTGMLEHAIALVWAGQVRKLVGAFFGETYPSSAPNKVIMKQAKEERLTLEYWTNLTIPQRFMAAANGFDYVPTRSLQGSSLLQTHLNSGVAFYTHDENTGKDTVMIRSLVPDVAIVHGSVADEDGNTVVTPPYGEDLWGIYAAKKVVVIAEKIVNAKKIESLSHLVKVPAHLVDAVVELPYSAHPFGVSPIGYSEHSYSEDYKFRTSFRHAVQRGESIETWMEREHLDVSHNRFLSHLGEERLHELERAARPNTTETIKHDDRPLTDVETFIIVSSRRIAQKIKAENYTMLLAGIGISHLTAWLVHRQLEAEGVKVQLLTETGFYGYKPALGDSYIFNFNNLYNNKKQSSFVEILGQMVGDKNHRTLAILSGAQIDQYGQINSTMIPEKNLFLTGSGGANDIAAVAHGVVAMMYGDGRKFVSTVPHVTSPGHHVHQIYTPEGVLERGDEADAFQVVEWMHKDSMSRFNQLIPWKADVHEKCEVAGPVSAKELTWLREFDPDRIFLA